MYAQTDGHCTCNNCTHTDRHTYIYVHIIITVRKNIIAAAHLHVHVVHGVHGKRHSSENDLVSGMLS